MDAKEKLKKFLQNPRVEFLLSVKEFESLSPYEQGFCHYAQSSWNESELETICSDITFQAGTKESDDFKKGSYAAMIWATETEE